MRPASPAKINLRASENAEQSQSQGQGGKDFLGLVNREEFPVNQVSYFWNIPFGTPLPSCLAGKFTEAIGDKSSVLSGYMKWAQQFTEQQGDQRNDLASSPGSIEIYSAVCERHPDAITGLKPPVQPATFGE